MPVVRVELAERSYSVNIERGLLDSVGRRTVDLGLRGPVAVITNPVVDRLYGKRLTMSLESAGLDPQVFVVPDGEEYKSLDEAGKIYDFLIERRMERESPIIAFGGGVIGDIAGFVAATYLRGVPYVQVPTTLLSQVDSSVGGKTAVNHPKGKNLIGAFYQPRAVFIDPDLLKTLDSRELRCGLAEVVKYGVIWDAGFFEFLEDNTEKLKGLDDEMVTAIERSCAIKAEVVSMDERERGLRSILNFGHTFGHAIEAVTGFRSIKHGEAVAMGMVMAAGLSNRLGLCDKGVVERIRGLLKRLGLRDLPGDIDGKTLIEPMKIDKKISGGKLRFVLVCEIGKVVLREVPLEEVEAFLGGI